MTLEPDVDRWFRETNPPLESTFRRVTELILTARFMRFDDLAAFVQPKANRVSLMFYRGAKIPGDFPHLEGDGPTARFMRFDDLADVRSKAKELRALAKAWCRLMAPS